MADTLRDKMERTASAMRADREPLEGDWRECDLLCSATRSRFLTTGRNKWKSRYNRALSDGYGVYAAGVCASGLGYGLISESQAWFKVKTLDNDLMERDGTKDVLGECERRMYAVLAKSGFYFASNSGFAQMTRFGVEAGLLLENPTLGAAAWSFQTGEYWLSQDNIFQTNRLHRRVTITVEQAYADYPGADFRRQVRDWYDRGDYTKTLTVCSMIEPNADRVLGKVNARNLPWRAISWDEGEDRKESLLKRSGYHEKPFWAARWDVTGNDTYPSTWPALAALADLRELQAVSKGTGDSFDYINRPPMAGPPNTRLNFNPGGYTAVAAADAAQRPTPLWTVPPQALQYGSKRVEESRQNIDRHFYVDRFLPITSMQGVQPRITQEINLRNQEAIAQLGAPVGRINVEKSMVVVERLWGIMLRTGQFPEFPPSLQGAELKIDFVSPLSQLMRLAGLDAIERTAQFVGFLAGANPKVLDKFDGDQAVDEFAQGAGVPPGVVRSDDAVDHIRDARAQQEQAQQTAQQLPALVDAAKAGQLMSQTNVGGTPLLDRVTGNG